MKAIRKRRFYKLTAFGIAVILMLGSFNSFLTLNDRRSKLFIKGFYLEPKDSLDVVLIGASELYTGFNSPLAWEEYGFTSYSITAAAFPGNLYKSALIEALKRQSPQLVVFEINGFLYSDEEMWKDDKQRRWLDNMPFSKNKVKTIRENIPKDQQYSYYVPLFKYHSNWQHPVKCLKSWEDVTIAKQNGYLLTKSFSTNTFIDKSTELKDVKRELGTKGQESLEELLSYCNEQNLDNVLFVRWPHKEKTIAKTQKVLDNIEEMVRAHGYDYVSFGNSYEEIGLELSEDFYNSQHLNIFGMQKYTAFFGDYLVQNYNLPSKHKEEIIEEWSECAEYMHRMVAYCEKKTKANAKKTVFEATNIGKK